MKTKTTKLIKRPSIEVEAAIAYRRKVALQNVGRRHSMRRTAEELGIAIGTIQAFRSQKRLNVDDRGNVIFDDLLLATLSTFRRALRFDVDHRRKPTADEPESAPVAAPAKPKTKPAPTPLFAGTGGDGSPASPNAIAVGVTGGQRKVADMLRLERDRLIAEVRRVEAALQAFLTT